MTFSLKIRPPVKVFWQHRLLFCSYLWLHFLISRACQEKWSPISVSMATSSDDVDNILYVLLISPCVHFTFRNSVADAHVHGIVSGLCWHRGRVLLGRPQIFCISNPQTCDRQQSSSRPKTYRRVRNLWTHSLCIVAMNVWFKYGLTDLITLFFLTSPWLHSVVLWFGPSNCQTSPDPAGLLL